MIRFYHRCFPHLWKLDQTMRKKRADLRMIGKGAERLTSDEHRQVVEIWNEYKKSALLSASFYKHYTGSFNPQYVPNSYYWWAERVLNLRWAAFFLQHKCCQDYFFPKINRPQTLLRKIDGHFVDQNDYEINVNEAISILKREKFFVWKRAWGTGGGKGVIPIDTTTTNLLDILAPQDIICQRILRQNEFMASFNQSSVNTIRMLTLNINGKCSVLSSFIRMGGEGSFVDNVASSKGIFVGINQDGFLSNYGYTKQFERKNKAPSGLKLGDVKIPSFNEIKGTVVDLHQKIPFVNLIAWDIAIDEHNCPIIIEINLDNGEIECHQVFNGPIFGERFNEVREYISERESQLRHAFIAF